MLDGPPMPGAPPASDPTVAGRYRLVRVLGAGGMGQVWEARHLETERRVAVKVLTGEGARHPDALARFRREARAATKIGHANIAEVLDFGVEPGGRAFLVTELLEGEDLDARIAAAGALPAREVVELLTPIMAALVAAHAHGVIHRDLKASNIFLARALGGGTRPVLLDFGLAKLQTSRVSGPVTAVGAALGTPYAMAPEQFVDASSVGPQADVWSMGVVLYEALAGAPPFDGASWYGLMHAITRSPPPPLRARAPDVPAALADIVHRALERGLGTRISSMSELLDRVLNCPDVRAQAWCEPLRRSHASAPTAPPAWTLDDLALDDDGPTAVRGAPRPIDDRATVRDPPPPPDDPRALAVQPGAVLAEIPDARTRRRASNGPRRRTTIAAAAVFASCGLSTLAVALSRGHESRAVPPASAPLAAPPTPSKGAIAALLAAPTRAPSIAASPFPTTPAPSTVTLRPVVASASASPLPLPLPHTARTHRARLTPSSVAAWPSSYATQPPGSAVAASDATNGATSSRLRPRRTYP